MPKKLMITWNIVMLASGASLLALWRHWSHSHLAFTRALEERHVADTLDFSLRTGAAAEQLAFYTCLWAGLAVATVLGAVMIWRRRTRRGGFAATK